MLSGADGFLYGTGSVGGNINYVLKRPTATNYSSVTIGDNAGGNSYFHGDFGGPIGKAGLFGFRLNVVGQTGNTSIEDQNINRDLFSTAFDYHPSSKLLVQLNYAHSDYDVNGISPAYSTTLNPFPKPADPSKIFNPSWVQFIDHTDTAGATFSWDINDTFTIRAAYDYTHEVRPTQEGIRTTITSYSGTEKQGLAGGSQPITWQTNANYFFIDSKFATFGAQNKLTVGYNGFQQLKSESSQNAAFGPYSGTNTFYDQVAIPPQQTLYSTGPAYTYGEGFGRNFVIGDEIKFGDRFTILAGGSDTVLGTSSFSLAGAYTGGYDKSGITPSASAIYKFLPWLSGYATYQESLQPGTQVLDSGTFIYTNNGVILAPYRGKQYEIGAKATINDAWLMTVALYDIDKANQYTQNNDDGTFTVIQSGREIHTGLELTATGKVSNDLTLIGGLNVMDPKVTSNPTSPIQNGQLPQGVSPVSGKVYLEENLRAVPGLTLIGGAQYASSYYASLPNVQRLPAYAVGDIGLRYLTNSKLPLILRFNVNNVTNQAYWVSSGIEGLPRTFLATLEKQL